MSKQYPPSRKQKPTARQAKQKARLPSLPPPTKQSRQIPVEPTIRNLPKKSLPDLARIWRNALALQRGATLEAELRKLVNAIGREWKRRRLSYDPNEYFKWPSTEVSGGGRGGLVTRGWPPEGLLRFMEYRVGRTQGVAAPLRQSILREVFQGELPPFHSPEYMTEWSSPKSAARLKKLAESIASFTRNAKYRRDSLMDDAVCDWESDVQFLYDEFYVGHFHFAWPTIVI